MLIAFVRGWFCWFCCPTKASVKTVVLAAWWRYKSKEESEGALFGVIQGIKREELSSELGFVEIDACVFEAKSF
jgi:hypothetical protein